MAKEISGKPYLHAARLGVFTCFAYQKGVRKEDFMRDEDGGGLGWCDLAVTKNMTGNLYTVAPAFF